MHRDIAKGRGDKGKEDKGLVPLVPRMDSFREKHQDHKVNHRQTFPHCRLPCPFVCAAYVDVTTNKIYPDQDNVRKQEYIHIQSFFGVYHVVISEASCVFANCSDTSNTLRASLINTYHFARPVCALGSDFVPCWSMSTLDCQEIVMVTDSPSSASSRQGVCGVCAICPFAYLLSEFGEQSAL